MSNVNRKSRAVFMATVPISYQAEHESTNHITLYYHPHRHLTSHGTTHRMEHVSIILRIFIHVLKAGYTDVLFILFMFVCL